MAVLMRKIGLPEDRDLDGVPPNRRDTFVLLQMHHARSLSCLMVVGRSGAGGWHWFRINKCLWPRGLVVFQG